MIISKWPLRKNLSINPNFVASGVDAWAAGQVATGAYITDSDGLSVFEHTYTGDGTVGQSMIVNRAPQRVPVNPALPYAAFFRFMRVNSLAPESVRMLAVQYDAAGAFLTSYTFVQNVSAPVGAWVDMRGVAMPGALRPEAASFALGVYPSASMGLAGGVTHFSKAMVVQSADAALPYFDGGSYGAEWDGLPNGSTSTLYARDISIDLAAPRYAAESSGLTF